MTSVLDIPIEIFEHNIFRKLSLSDIASLRKSCCHFASIEMINEKRIKKLEQKRPLTLIKMIHSNDPHSFARSTLETIILCYIDYYNDEGNITIDNDTLSSLDKIKELRIPEPSQKPLTNTDHYLSKFKYWIKSKTKTELDYIIPLWHHYSNIIWYDISKMLEGVKCPIYICSVYERWKIRQIKVIDYLEIVFEWVLQNYEFTNLD